MLDGALQRVWLHAAARALLRCVHASMRRISKRALPHTPLRSVLIVMDNGRPSGVAFVEFPTPQEATTAMGKNKQMMGSRYVEMFPANRADLERYKARGGF